MAALWMLAIIAWSIVPYKAWSRALLGFEGLNLGDIVFVLLSWPFVLQVFRERKKNPVFLVIMFLWVVVAISTMKGLVYGEDLREMARVIRGVLFWSLVPMMVSIIRSYSELRRWFSGMSVIVMIASLTIVLFSFFPSIIPVDDEVGVFREEALGSFERIFTLGMWAVYCGCLVSLGALMFSRRYKFVALMLFGVFMLGLSFTFARTFYVGLLMGATLLLLFTNKEVLRTLVVSGTVLTVIIVLVGIPDFVTGLVEAVVGRTATLLTDDPELAFQTFFWRLSEFDSMTANMVGDWDKYLGVLGRIYVLPDGYGSSMPHVSYFGIYYGHGYLGVLVYFALIGVVTLRMKRSISLSKGTAYHWVTVAAFVAWICLLATAVSGPAFQFSWGVSVMAFMVGLSEAARNLLETERITVRAIA